jgi:probable HAF family extracellular repeat protein
MAISDRGDVVVSAVGNAHHAFHWRDGVMRDLNVAAQIPGGVTEFETALAVNNLGVAVGLATDGLPSGGKQYAFIASSEPATAIALPDAGLFAINDRGQAVGSILLDSPAIGPDRWAAAIYEEGRLQNLNELIPNDSQFFLTRARH